MARKKSRRRRNGFSIPVALALPIASVSLEFYDDAQRMGFQEAVRWQLAKWTGYYAQPNQPDWKLKHMRHAALPVGVGFLIHKAASKFGLNRALAQAGIPILRI